MVTCEEYVALYHRLAAEGQSPLGAAQELVRWQAGENSLEARREVREERYQARTAAGRERRGDELDRWSRKDFLAEQPGDEHFAVIDGRLLPT